jgi:hypothetical protein
MADNTTSDPAQLSTLINRVWLDQLEQGGDLVAVDDVAPAGRLFGLEIWSATLVYPEREAQVWIVLGQKLAYYLRAGRLREDESEFRSAVDAAIFHHGRIRLAGAL